MTLWPVPKQAGHSSDEIIGLSPVTTRIESREIVNLYRLGSQRTKL
jgi:hypothetical protein